jgi:hypothetical protein
MDLNEIKINHFGFWGKAKFPIGENATKNTNYPAFSITEFLAPFGLPRCDPDGVMYL